MLKFDLRNFQRFSSSSLRHKKFQRKRNRRSVCGREKCVNLETFQVYNTTLPKGLRAVIINRVFCGCPGDEFVLKDSHKLHLKAYNCMFACVCCSYARTADHAKVLWIVIFKCFCAAIKPPWRREKHVSSNGIFWCLEGHLKSAVQGVCRIKLNAPLIRRDYH